MSKTVPVHLSRFLELHDSYRTQVFTFIIENRSTALALDSSSCDLLDGSSDAFTYAFNSWKISLAFSESKLSEIALKMLNTSRGLKCMIDYSFTLLNDKNYHKNIACAQKKVAFNENNKLSKWKAMLSLRGLEEEGYSIDGNLVLELQLRSAITMFETDISIKDSIMKDSTFPRFETPSFTYGGYDWTVIVHPRGNHIGTENQVLFQLLRLTNFNTLCRLGMQVVLKFDGKMIEATTEENILENTFEEHAGKRIDFIFASGNLEDTGKTEPVINIQLKLLYALATTRIPLGPADIYGSSHYFKDQNGHRWCAQISRYNSSSGALNCKLFYLDKKGLHENSLRVVCWSVATYTCSGHHQQNSQQQTQSAYYGRHSRDGVISFQGITQATQFPSFTSYFLEESERMYLELVQNNSQFLYQSCYGKTDDVQRRQVYQLRKELVKISTK